MNAGVFKVNSVQPIWPNRTLFQSKFLATPCYQKFVKYYTATQAFIMGATTLLVGGGRSSHANAQ